MRTAAAFSALAGFLAIGPTGCSRPQPALQFSTLRLPADMTPDDEDRLWSAAELALRDRGYDLDRMDRSAGILTTRPVVSQQFFEFWRRDVVTWHDWFEASLNVIRRWVDVRRVQDEARSCLIVTVFKQRLTAPDRQFNSSGAAYRIFTGNLPTATGELRVHPDQIRWIDLGRDAALEAELTTEIAERGGFGTFAVESLDSSGPT